MKKRDFLRSVGGASLGLTLGHVSTLFAEVQGRPPAELAQNEAFWAAIRAKYKLKPDYINLENGYYSMQPQEVLEAFIARVREINTEASYYMRTRQYPDKAAVGARLAGLAGCGPDEN